MSLEVFLVELEYFKTLYDLEAIEVRVDSNCMTITAIKGTTRLRKCVEFDDIKGSINHHTVLAPFFRRCAEL